MGDTGCDDVGPGEESPDRLPDDDQPATRKQQGTEDKVAAEGVAFVIGRASWSPGDEIEPGGVFML